MPGKNDSQIDPHVQDKKNDPAPTKGTTEPWNRPGQKSQNPGELEAPRPDLDRWNKAIRGG